MNTVSYHPLLNELILIETLKYLNICDLRKLKTTNSIWKNVIDFMGAMNHQWVQTHHQLKTMQNINKFRYPQRQSFCPNKGCYISSYCNDDIMIIEFSDVTKTFHYRYIVSEKNKDLCEHTAPLWNNVCVIPSVFCKDAVDHYMLRIKFTSCHYFIDYSDFTNIFHYHCHLNFQLPYTNEFGFHHVHLSLLYDAFSLDLSTMKFLVLSKFQQVFTSERSHFYFFHNRNNKSFFIKKQEGEFKSISVFKQGKLLCNKSLKIANDVIHIHGVCGHLMLIKTDGFVQVYDFNQDGKHVSTFNIRTSIRIRQVLTLSDFQFCILFQFDELGAYFINLNNQTITEIIEYQLLLNSLLYTTNVTQLNEGIFMCLGCHDQKFFQVIIDTQKQTLVQNTDFNQLQDFAQEYRP